MKLLLNLLLAVLTLAPSCFAEHICRASVSYAWQREKDVTKIIVFVGTLEAKGADEAAAKLELQERAEREKNKASEQCTREHENQSGCVAAKMTSMSAAIQSLTFSARKLIEESIASDCKSQQGKCSESAMSEPRCVEKVEPTKAAGKDAGKEAGKEAAGKDSKKKK